MRAIIMNLKDKVVKELYEFKRIIQVSNKPTMEEFLTIAKISAIGAGIIGLLGFVIQLIGTIIV
ncbi:protein translocase SEC61 complex subunit gamma [archaeon CG_4_8_14_3_um_filter_38_5]|nr:MAG: protein translocase SEC61 complex subunit gamma [archaeon CG06_land_8_20_14_3_00_37_11]PIX43026.1 MAG: protein translocase SEC61 complex subunit gamma [archaeon CG_4_8_14_3_um_filter_38_5]